MAETAKSIVADDGRICRMGRREATVDDLRHVEGKAELVNGELVLMSADGFRHGRVAGRIFASLLAYEERTHNGYALPDNVGFVVNLEHRRSFCADAAFVTQALTDDFVDGAPVFAAEGQGDGGLRSSRRARADCEACRLLRRWNSRCLGC